MRSAPSTSSTSKASSSKSRTSCTSISNSRRATSRGCAKASARWRVTATIGFLAAEVLQRFGIKGEVAAAEVDVGALLAATGEWKMAPVARFPGVPMIMAMTHGLDLEYRRVIETIRSLDVPYLHEVGLRDRYPTQDGVKTTLGMWYQAFDRSLTQDEVSDAHNRLGERLAALLPVKLLSQETR